MIGRALALGAALILLSAVGAQAQDDDEEAIDYSRSGSYASLYASYANFQDGHDNHSGGGGAIVGYYFLPQLAMETQVEGQSDDATLLWTYNVKYVPFPKLRIQPYLKAGLGLMAGRDDDEWLFTGRFSGGFDFFLSETIAMFAAYDYARAGSHGHDAHIANLGVTLFFD